VNLVKLSKSTVKALQMARCTRLRSPSGSKASNIGAYFSIELSLFSLLFGGFDSAPLSIGHSASLHIGVPDLSMHAIYGDVSGGSCINIVTARNHSNLVFRELGGSASLPFRPLHRHASLLGNCMLIPSLSTDSDCARRSIS